MSRIPDRQIEEILDRLDIVEVIGEYTPLKRAGRNFKACCPFHTEKTPSFTVSQEKQIWHCFGCSIGGNFLSFVMRYENVSFPEAVRIMAEKAGIRLEVPAEDESRTDDRSDLYDANERAVRFYHEQLTKSPEGKGAREYLLERGIDDATRDRFRLGWSPRARGGFLRWARQQGLSSATLERAGLIMSQGASGATDRFWSRLMFPIADPRGRVVGFGARVLDKSLPKYINSPDSELFHKSRSLYGVQATVTQIRKTRHVICVEGYMDLLMLYQNGIHNVAATLGTALTSEHGRLIRRWADECTLVFDADRAGEEAALRGAEVLMPYDMGVKIMRLEQAKDPDDLVRSQGPEHFLELVKSARELFDFKLKLMIERYETRDVRAQWKIVSSLIPTLSATPNAVVRAGYIRRLANTLSVPEEAIRIELNKAGRRRQNTSSPKPSPAPAFHHSDYPEERILVGLMLGDEEAVAFVKEHLNPQDFRHEGFRSIVELVFNETANGGSCEPARLVGLAAASNMSDLLTALVSSSVEYEERSQMMVDCIRRIKDNHKRTQLANLSNRLKQADETGDDSLRTQLLSEFQRVRASESTSGMES